MATVIIRDGGYLKVTIGTSRPKYFCLQKIEVAIKGDFVYLHDGNPINFNDVSTPSVGSAEALADIIGTYIYQYNTGQ